MKNLRGTRVTFQLDGKTNVGTVLTRIRDTRWMVVCSTLPGRYRRPDGSRRITLDRSEFDIAPDAPLVGVRKALSPIERMIDIACGVNDGEPT
jgi:hypothetical protein